MSTNYFPKPSTPPDSLSFVKRLIDFTIATILCIRKIIPHFEFEKRIVDGITYKVFKRTTQSKGCLRIKTWLSGAFDALEKKYLKGMALEIKDPRSDLTLEVYTITIHYENENSLLTVGLIPGQRKFTSCRNLKEGTQNIELETLRLLQMCSMVTKNYTELPGEIALSMKLSFYENTPPDYQPFGYKDCVPLMPVFANKTTKIELGSVNTSYHFIKMINKTCFVEDRIMEELRNIENTQKIPNSPKSRGRNIVPSRDDLDLSFLKSSQSDKTNETDKEIGSQTTDDALNTDIVRCPCLSQIKTSLMYQCFGCSHWVHAECFGISVVSEPTKIDFFYCHICHKLNKNHLCHDKKMVRLQHATDQQKLAVKRRLLSYCSRSERQELSFQKFQKVTGLKFQEKTLQAILNEMINWNVLNTSSGNTYNVNKNFMVKKMKEYFYSGPFTKCETSVGTIKNRVFKKQSLQDKGKTKTGEKIITTFNMKPMRAAKKHALKRLYDYK